MRRIIITGSIIVAAIISVQWFANKQSGQGLSLQSDALIDTKNEAAVSQSEAVLACRAFAASFGGIDLEQTVGNVHEEEVRASYIRQSDQTRWEYACRVSNGKITWAAVNSSIRGRWRTEDRVEYVIGGRTITIRDYMGGSTPVETAFELGQS